MNHPPGSSRNTCLTCGSAETTTRMWIDRQGIPPGEDGHIIAYSHCVFATCANCGAGQVERLTHDCFDLEEVWDQFEWYVLSRGDTALFLTHLDTCPAPLSPDCSCALHINLRFTCAALPARPWVSSLSAEEHVQAVTLRMKDGLAEIVPATTAQ